MCRWHGLARWRSGTLHPMQRQPPPSPQVISGYGVVRAMEACGSRSGQTSFDVMIADCGVKTGKAPTTAALQAPGSPAPRARSKAAALAQPRMAAQLKQQRAAMLQGRAVAPARRRPQAARTAAVAAVPARALAVL